MMTKQELKTQLDNAQARADASQNIANEAMDLAERLQSIADGDLLALNEAQVAYDA